MRDRREATFDVRGGALHVTGTHIVLKGKIVINIPFADVEACRSRRRTLEIVWRQPGRTRLTLHVVSAPAAAAEAAVFGVLGDGRACT